MPTETRTIEQIEAEMAEVDRLRAPLLARMDELVRERAQLRSLQWIQANGCRREDVQFSDAHGLPYFTIFDTFAQWLKRTECPNRFCEWDGRLYFTSEVTAFRFDRNPPGRAEDLPE